MSESLQVWVRNDKGQVFGPLSPSSIELLLDNGIVPGRVQVSTNGLDYVFPGRVPGLRMIFPRELWGETVTPGDEIDAQWSQPAPLASFPGEVRASSPSGIAPARGPAPAGPVAGPGARTQQQQRALNASQLNANNAAQMNISRPSGIASVGEFLSTTSGIRSAAPAPTLSVTEIMSQISTAPPPGAPPMISAPSQVAFVPPPAPFTPSPAPQPAPAYTASPSRVVSAPDASPIPTASDIPMPEDGPLTGDLSAMHLYGRAAAGKHTGELTLFTADREIAIHFRKGTPEFIDSTHAEDTMDTFLVAQGLATPEQIAQALPEVERFGGDLLPTLFGLGLVNPNAVFQKLGVRSSTLLVRGLAAEKGDFVFESIELPPSRSLPWGNKWAVYLEALRRVPGPEAARRLGGALDLPVMKGSGLVPLSEVKLTAQETRVLTYFDGVRSLRQLMRDVPNEADTILRTAWMLNPLELVTFAGVRLEAAKAPPHAARPVPAAAPPPAAAPQRPPPPVMTAAAPVAAPQRPPPPVMTAAAPAAVPQRPPPPVMGARAAPPAYPQGPVKTHDHDGPLNPPVRSSPSQVATPAKARPTVTAAAPAPLEDAKPFEAQLAAIKGKNYFEILGIKRDADANAVKMAYLKAARSYHPDTVPPGAPEALAKVKADLFALVGEANRTLSDPAMRREYEGELDAGGTGSKVDIEKILRAEELFQKGRILVTARKYPEAFATFEESILNNADEPEFYAWRGYTRFLIAPDKKAAMNEVMRDLKLCVDRSPNTAAVHYFLGFVAKANGDLKGAANHFKKCVSLDPKHIDAARELRTMK